MARQLNVNLVFNANTTQAKLQMTSLQTNINLLLASLNKQMSMSGLTTELNKALSAVSSLKANLNSAFDVNTGKLDLTRFNLNLLRSGMTLKQYRNSLSSLGTLGQLAFNQLTSAIVQGLLPLHKTNNLLTSMMNTFGNSIKWSLAYGAINKISRGFLNAFKYAQDLNASLTNIRVVTGKGVEEMARFAESANKAAKILGTTTTAYTDAALIYYQLGLDGKAVEERAEATLKLANVTGLSAQEVSDLLTAVWNNFYDGSKSLEYYADTLAALGAATASSADEISDGLEKFAAVAETVGLSFEYATTALATITAETRQSADIVGTALKTLFARMQDLELGKTLEDGTTLGLYSESMAKVGVNIKTANGDLKDMDQILNEMGQKWKLLEKDLQVALAKSVAGIRQYSQMMALMDNWDAFEMNLAVAQSSEGALQELLDIWAESWEAAQNRVKASAEDLYNVLINDDFFINLNNIFADLLTGASEFVEAIGGLKTLLPMIAGLMLQAFGPLILNTFTNFKNNLFGPSKATLAQALALRTEAMKLDSSMASDSSSHATQARSKAAKDTLRIYEAIEGIERKLTEEEVAAIQYRIDYNKEILHSVELLALELDLLELTTNKGVQNQNSAKTALLNGISSKTNRQKLEGVMNNMSRAQQTASAAQVSAEKFGTVDFRDKKARTSAALDLMSKYSQMDQKVLKGSVDNKTLRGIKKFAAGKGTDLEFAKLQKVILGTNVELALYNKNTQVGLTAVAEFADKVQGGKEAMQQYVNGLKDGHGATEHMAGATENYVRVQEKAKKATKETLTAINGFAKMKPGEIFMGVASGCASMVSALSMAHSSMQSLFEMFKTGEHSISGWLGALSGILFALPMFSSGLAVLGHTLENIVTALNSHTLSIDKKTKKIIENNIVSKANKKTSDDAQEESAESAAATAIEEQALEDLNEEILKNIGLEKLQDKKEKSRGYGRIDGGKFSNGSTRISGKTTLGDLRNSGDLTIAGDKKLKKPNLKNTKTGKNLQSGSQGIGAFFSNNSAAIGNFAGGAGIALIGIAAIVAGITLMVKGFNKHNKQLKEATTNAAFLKQEYEGVVEATNQLNENVSKYDELLNKLNGLVKGTFEYKQALVESNNAAMELIKSNKALQEPGAYLVVNGEIIIDSAAMEKALKELLQKQLTALAVSNRAEIEKKLAAYNKELVDTLRDTGKGFNANAGWGIGGGAVGAAAGGMLLSGAVNGWNPVGWALLAAGALTAVGSIVAGATVGSSTDEEERATEHLAKLWEDNPDMFKSKETLKVALGPEFDHLTDAMWENRESMENLIKSNQELQLQEELLRLLIATAIVDKKYSDIDEREQDALATSTANILGSEGVEKAQDELYKEIQDQDGLVQDLYNYFHKSEGTTVKVKARNKATITKADGTTEDTTQNAIALSAASAMAQAMAEGDATTIDEIYGIIKSASGVSSGNEEDINDLLEKLDISDEMAEAAKTISKRSDALDRIEAFSGTSNKASHSLLLNAISAGEDKLEDTDFSFLTREELAALENNINQFDSATQKIIQQGIDTYEEKRVRANMKANEAFESEAYELEERAKVISKAGLNDAEFEAFATTIANTYGVALEQAEELAEANLRVKNGLTGLHESYKKYGQYLDASYKGTLNYSKGVAAVLQNMNDWFGVTFDTETIEQNLPDIELALSGDTEAIERLLNLAAKELIVDIDLPNQLETAVLNAITDLLNTDIEVGMTLDDTQAGKTLKALYESLHAAGLMSTEQIQNSLEALGYDVNTKKTREEKVVTIFGIDIKYEGDEIETIDWENTKYSGDFSSKAIDWKPEESETSLEKKRRHKELDEEIKRYRLLDETVEDLERDLANLGKAKDRAFGGNKLALMEQERKMLEEDVKLAEERLRLAEEYLQQDRADLGQYGVVANEDGQITNWDEILLKQINTLKNMSPDDSGYAEEEEKLKDMLSAYDKYMQTLDEVKDAHLGVIDSHNALIDSALEAAEYKVEFKIEADEFTMELLEHLLSRLEDNAFKTAEAISTIGLQMEVTAGQVDTYMKGIEDVLGATLSSEEIQKVMAGDLSGIDTSKLTELLIEDLKEYANGLMEVENQLREQHTAVHEKLTETIEFWNEEFDKNMAKFDKYNAVVENYKNIIDIVGKDSLGIDNETIKNMYDTQKQIANDLLAAAKTRKEAAQTTYDEMKAAYDNAVALYGEDSEIAKKWKEQMDDAEETLNNATSEFYDSWLNALLAAADAFAASVETIVENFEKSVSGAYGSLDALQEAFERQQEINGRYLDTYEKTYEINKLNRKINQDIAKTINIKSQKELRDLQELLLDLNKEGSKVSERDIQFMQKKYDLLLAELALRDAQNAKSVVRLQRDSEGNYGYVYTADLSNIDATQQTYEDAKYNLEKWNEESLITISELIITIKQNFAQAIQDISNDTTLNDEERKLKMAETTAYYVDKLRYWTDEAVNLNEYAYQANSQFHMDMADSIHNSIIGNIFPDLNDWEELYTNDTEAMMEASEDLGDTIDDMADDIKEAMRIAGISVDNFEEKINEDFVAVQNGAKKTKEKIEELKNTVATELPRAISGVLIFENKFNGYMDSIQLKIDNVVIPAIMRLIAQCKEGLAALKALEEKDYSYNGNTGGGTGGSGNTGGGTGGSGNTGGGTGGSGNTDSNQTKFWTKTGNTHNYTGENMEVLAPEDVNYSLYLYRKQGGDYITDGSITRSYSGRLLDSLKWTIANSYLYDNGKNGGPYVLATAQETDAANGIYEGQEWLIPTSRANQWWSPKYFTFDTGGYTGSWGPEGRLAMLHQKEIVLNAHDTENLLSIISMVRDMSDRIELNARAMQYGLTAAYTANNIKSQNDTLQLEVHITAEFPNATNHSEIEEAFRNLTNLASQYANRKF